MELLNDFLPFAHVMALVLTSITFLLVLLGLCKFFYVQPFHDVFDSLDKSMDYTLVTTTVVLLFTTVIYDVGVVVLVWTFFVVMGTIIVTVINAVFIFFISIPVVKKIYDYFDDLHESIKHKKTR